MHPRLAEGAGPGEGLRCQREDQIGSAAEACPSASSYPRLWPTGSATAWVPNHWQEVQAHRRRPQR